MLTPNIDIRIKNDAKEILFFDYVVEGDIVSSWQELTNTAKFTLPRKVSKLGDELPKLIQVGNEVSIRLGHDGEFAEEFKGFITNIGSNVPVEIECEDLMYKLKQTEVNETWRKTDLQTVIKKIVPSGIEFEVDNRQLGDLRLSKVTVAGVLEKLKEMFGIVSYVRNGKLHVGDAYNVSWRANPKYKVKYHFQKNVIKNDLAFKTKKDVKVRVECISMNGNGEAEKYVFPETEKDGELHTFHYGNITKSELKKHAQAMYDKIQYDGFRGSFTTFGTPFIDHGFVASMEDDFYPEHNGDYLVDKVTTRFGLAGYKKDLKIGGKV